MVFGVKMTHQGLYALRFEDILPGEYHKPEKCISVAMLREFRREWEKKLIG